MKCNLDQLEQQLKNTLSPLYMVSGDEALLCQEATAQIKSKARELGYDEQQILVYEKGFEWQQLKYEIQNQSLFSNKKVIELRLNTNKIGDEGSKAIQEIISQSTDDTLVLISGPKLDSSVQKSKWVKELVKQAVLVQVWPIDLNRLPQWIQNRANKKGIELTREALVLLVDRVEGNLLAASQEIDKLWLINGSGRVDVDVIKQSITDSAKYNIYVLVDYCLQANVGKVAHVLEGLKNEGVEPVLIVWALTREIRSLTQMAQKSALGSTIEAVLMEYRVWEKRKPLVRAALSRYSANQWFQILAECEKIDRQTKGLDNLNVWDSLLRLCLVLTGNFLFHSRVKKNVH